MGVGISLNILPALGTFFSPIGLPSLGLIRVFFFLVYCFVLFSFYPFWGEK